MATNTGKVFLIGSYVTSDGEYGAEPTPLLDMGAFLTREAAQDMIDLHKNAAMKIRRENYEASKKSHSRLVEDAASRYESALAEHGVLVKAGIRKANQAPQKPDILSEKFPTEKEWFEIPFNKYVNDLTVIDVRVN